MSAKHWSIATAIEQIKSCDFECEAGPLTHNEAWQWLEAAAKVGPEYWPGQGVWYEVSGTVQGVELKGWKHFYIVACNMTADCDGRYWTYNLSYDPPGPWHYGTTHFLGVDGRKLSITSPVQEPTQ